MRLLLLLSLGCTGESQETPQEHHTPDEREWGWADPDAGGPVEPVPVGTLQALINEAIVQLFNVDPSIIYGPFESLLTEIAEPGCPTITHREERTDIAGNCTTSAGISVFAEQVRYYQKGPYDTPSGVSVSVDGYLSGDAIIIQPSGERWEMSDFIVSDERVLSGGIRQLVSRLIGITHAEDAGGWATQNLSKALEQTWYTTPDGSTPAAYLLKGGVSGFVSSELVAFDLANLAFQTEESGGPCGVEPSGTISLLPRDSGWHHIVFSGPDPFNEEIVTAAADCDGCGEVFFAGELLGEICPDLQGLLEWTERPW